MINNRGYAILLMFNTTMRTQRDMKHKHNQKNRFYSSLQSLFGVVLVGLFLIVGMGFTPVGANLQDQIDELNEQNAKKEANQNELEEEAVSLQDKIAKLQQRINTLQEQISQNENEIAKLEVKIKEAEIELEKQRDLLGKNIRAMYVEGDISTLEMLASSKDLSEFVDKEQYRTSVQEKIKNTLDKVNELKHQLNTQRETLAQRVDELKRNRAEIALEKEEQDELLGLNTNERESLDAQIKKNSKRIEELKRQQAEENMRLFGGSGGVIGGGGYPWGGAKCIHTGQVDGWCPNYDWGVNGSVWNPATGGYGYRNCTDWVSYRVRSSGRFVPGGLGNANTWDDRAPSYGYKVSSKPKAGAAAVSNGGFYGHVMYVESVNSNGTIVVSDYNRAGTGKYDITTISASGLSFVYF